MREIRKLFTFSVLCNDATNIDGVEIGDPTETALLNLGGKTTLASTMAFATLCMGRLVHGFNCKSDKPVIFTKKFFNNKYLIGAFLLGSVLVTGIIMIPQMQMLFKVQTLTVAQLLTVYLLAFLNLPVIQGIKAIQRWWKKRVN